MRYSFILFALFCLGAGGCGPATTEVESEEHSHGEDGHSHGHGHSHADTGPHGGHLVELGDEEYHVEWLHDDASGLVTVYILDGDAAAEFPIQASQVTIDVTIGEKASQHPLEAVAAADGIGAAQFQLSDKPLIEALKIAGQGAEAQITVEIKGQTYIGHFEHHEH